MRNPRTGPRNTSLQVILYLQTGVLSLSHILRLDVLIAHQRPKRRKTRQNVSYGKEVQAFSECANRAERSLSHVFWVQVMVTGA